MKAILTGATGYIGGEVLSQCIANPKITSIVVLSRRDLTGAAGNNPKVKTIIIKDFLNYPDTVLEEVKDADICIWSLGTYTGGESVETAFPLAFCKAVSPVQDATSTRPFRFVFLSGTFVRTDQDESLWFGSVTRKAKGMTETKLFAFAEDRQLNQGPWEAYVVRPAWVNSKPVFAAIFGNRWMIRVDQLGAAMIDTALNGHAERRLLHPAVVAKGKAAMMKNASAKSAEQVLIEG